MLTFEQENDYINKAVAQMQLGYLETRLGNYEEASFMYNQALPIMEKDEYNSNRVDLITLIGELEEYADNHTKANEQYKIAINISEEIGYDLGKGNALLHLGELKIKEKNVEEARTYFNEAMTIFKKVSHKLGEYNTHLLNANLILRLEQNPQAALEHLQKAGAGFEAIGGREGVAEVGFYRAEACHQMQQPEKALEQYQEALTLSEILNIAPLNVLAKETAAIIGIAGIAKQAPIA